MAIGQDPKDTGASQGPIVSSDFWFVKMKMFASCSLVTLTALSPLSLCILRIWIKLP